MATSRDFDLDGNVAVGGDLTADTLEATTTAPATPTLGKIYADGILFARAVVTNSGTPTLVADVNVSGLVDNGLGDVTVTFATAYGSTNYSATVSAVDAGNNASADVYSKASGSVRIITKEMSATSADHDFDLNVFG